MAAGKRTAEQIQAEIEDVLGFFPPFFEPAVDAPDLLENLWQHLSALFEQEPALRSFFERYREIVAEEQVRSVDRLAALERDHGRRALRESEQRFRTVFEEGPLGIAIIARDFRFLEVNAALCAMLGYTEDELTSVRFPDITHPEDVAIDVRLAERVFKGDVSAYRIEKRFIRKGGDVFWGELTASAILDESGRVLYGLGMLENISGRKRAEEAFRETQRYYRLVAENAADVIFTTDLNLRPTYISPSVSRVTGYSVDEAMLRTLEDRLTPASLDRVRRTMAEGVAQGAVDAPPSWMMELEFRRKDGSTVWTEVHGRLLRDADGRPTEVLGVMRDISQRKATEEALRETERLLAVSQERERLAATIHDALSQVLFSVGLKLNWCLHRLPRCSEVESKLQEIKKENAHIMSQMRDLILHLSTGRRPEQSIADRLAALVAQVQELTGIHARLVADGDLTALDPEAEEVLQKTVQEALVNVAKHARATRVEVRLEVGEGELRFEVSDDGVGPPAGFLGLVETQGHFGIRHMRERLRAVGGRMDVGAGVLSGFRISGALPVR